MYRLQETVRSHPVLARLAGLEVALLAVGLTLDAVKTPMAVEPYADTPGVLAGWLAVASVVIGAILVGSVLFALLVGLHGRLGRRTNPERFLSPRQRAVLRREAALRAEAETAVPVTAD